MQNMTFDDLITVKAKFKLKPTALGGRRTAIRSGYRPNHVFEYDENGNIASAWMGKVIFEKEWMEPGEEQIVTVAFNRQPYVENYIKVGYKWWIHEGPNLVGEAEILEI